MAELPSNNEEERKDTRSLWQNRALGAYLIGQEKERELRDLKKVYKSQKIAQNDRKEMEELLEATVEKQQSILHSQGQLESAGKDDVQCLEEEICLIENRNARLIAQLQEIEEKRAINHHLQLISEKRVTLMLKVGNQDLERLNIDTEEGGMAFVRVQDLKRRFDCIETDRSSEMENSAGNLILDTLGGHSAMLILYGVHCAKFFEAGFQQLFQHVGAMREFEVTSTIFFQVRDFDLRTFKVNDLKSQGVVSDCEQLGEVFSRLSDKTTHVMRVEVKQKKKSGFVYVWKLGFHDCRYGKTLTSLHKMAEDADRLGKEEKSFFKWILEKDYNWQTLVLISPSKLVGGVKEEEILFWGV